MSRNGSSLIYQILFGHPQLTFYPGRITFICSNEQGWPFVNHSNNIKNVIREILEKHSIYEGNQWHTLKLKNIRLASSLNFSKLKEKIEDGIKHVSLKDFKSIYNFVTDKYITEMILGGYHFNKKASYCVFQEDYLFLIPPSKINIKLGESYHIQTIRNLNDVIASRKNMLLHHVNFYGDPKDRTLRKRVIENEILRWLWSVISAVFNSKDTPSNYFVLPFEGLKHNASAILDNLLKTFHLEYDKCFEYETSFDKNYLCGDVAMLKVAPSIAKITKNRVQKTVNSYIHSLNDAEKNYMSELFRIFNNEDIDLNYYDCNFQSDLEKFVSKNLENFEKIPFIKTCFNLKKLGKYKNIIKLYSKLNHGNKEAHVAFE